MAGLTPQVSFFNFNAANANNQVTEIGSQQPNPVYRYPNSPLHQFPHPRSTMGAQLMQQTGPRAAVTNLSPAIPAPFAPGMQQQWPTHSLMNQNLGTSQFSHRGSTVPYLPTQQQQQQQQIRPQIHVQQQWPTPPPEIQNRGAIHNTYQQPPAQCKKRTEDFKVIFGSSKGMISEPRPYIHPQPSASSPPNTQQQNAPLSPNVLYPRFRPDHRPQQLGSFPTGPNHLPAGHTRKPTQEVQPTLSAVQPYQPNANHTPPVTQTRQQPANVTTTHLHNTSPFLTPPKTPSPPTNPKAPPKSTTTNNRKETRTKTPTKNSKPEGISRTPGRKRKDHGKTGFINETIPAGEHTNTTTHGRSELRSEARAAEWYNQPVEATKRKKKKSNNESTSKGEADGSKSTTNMNNNKDNNNDNNVVQVITEPTTEPTAEPLGAVPVQRAGREEAEDGMAAAVNQEGVSAGPPAVEIGTPAAVNQEGVSAGPPAVEMGKPAQGQGQEQELRLELGMTNYSDMPDVNIQEMDLDGELEGFDFDKAQSVQR